MPFIEVNGARLFYETYGQERPGKAPVVLIHGSTGTGQSNWSVVAPLLAREYYVIVPDCRGHGQSSNPNHSYTFQELAADTAALVRQLGFDRAHIIGHSNGGNVALVILMEHPEVVQTAVLQAANAWVSPDLVEKEPPVFDPDRVARESPDWMNRMIELHSETHGPEYWRDLLKMTVAELIAEPNYTPADLERVQRPTLVIQGENDSVNAPFRHAQFIARYVPNAELWIPPGTGHTVHDELLFEWVSRILDFLKRRGEAENELIYRLGRQRYPDDRLSIFDVRGTAVPTLGENSLKLTGQVLTAEQRQAALELFPGHTVMDEIEVLLTDETPWALVNWAVADLRREPRRLSERVSQTLLGEALCILAERGEWAKVRLEHDGYLGWVHINALHRCDRQQVESYQKACTHLVAGEIVPAFDSSGKAGPAAGKLPFGVCVPVEEVDAGMASVRLPDGKCWWVSETALLPLASRPQPDEQGLVQTLALVHRFAGVPYLWGGRTPFGFDCSGLAQAFLGFMGVQIPRDTDQQFAAGSPVSAEFRPGDLLYFGDPVEDIPYIGSAFGQESRGEQGGQAKAAPERVISHVAISLGGADVIHARGSAGRVTYNSLDPGSPRFSPSLKETLAGARRFS